ncbi:MAG: cytochrome P450 [Acidobacteriota bacterium]
MSFIDYLRQKRDELADKLSDDSKDVHSDVLDEVEKGFEGIREDLSDTIAKIQACALENADRIFALLRKIKPIVVFRDFALVTRFDDVQEVLSHDNVFQTLYPEKLEAVGGVPEGTLGQPNNPGHQRDVANMSVAFRREDIPDRIVPWIRQHAEQAVAASNGRLDVVSGLTRYVPPRWIGQYIGIPGPSPEQLADWADSIFRYIFTDLDNDPAIAGPSLESAKEFRQYIDGVMAERKQNRGQHDDVLERFLAMQDIDLPGMFDARIRATLMIMVYGTVTLSAKAPAQAIDELLRRPKELAAAQEAARAGNTERVAKYVWEALRFSAVNPGLFRTATEDYIVAKGNMRATKIPKGTRVFAALESAMLDEHELDDPTEFRIDRPAYQFMHFGHGLHECFGRYVSYQQVPILVQEVLKQKNLRRAPGADGELEIRDRVFPVKMVVEFDT